MQGDGSCFQYHILTLVSMFSNELEWFRKKIRQNYPWLTYFRSFREMFGRFRSFWVNKDDEMSTKDRKKIMNILPRAFLNALLTWFCDNVYGAFWTSKLSLWLSHLLPPTDRRFRLRKSCTNAESSDSKSPSWFPQRGCSTRWRVCSSSLPVWAKPESCWSWRRAVLNCLNKYLRLI